MNLEDIKAELNGKLDANFKSYEINFIDALTDKVLFIFDYSPHGETQKNAASFALSLENYDSNSFPKKCWITSKLLREIKEKKPALKEEYINFEHKNKDFTAYSTNLSEYKSKDISSIKSLINELYQHIIF